VLSGLLSEDWKVLHTSLNKSTESYENIGVKLHVVTHVPVLNELAAKKKEIQAFLTLKWHFGCWIHNVVYHSSPLMDICGENCDKFSEFSLYNSKDLSNISLTGVCISSSCKSLAMTSNTIPFLIMAAL